MPTKILASVLKETLLSTPLPKRTRSYSPVPHKVIIDTVLESFDKANIKIINEWYTSAKDGRQANGFYELLGGDDEMNLRLQWQNSYNKSLPLASAMGSHVIVCSNGLVVGDIFRFKKKHTGNVLEEFKENVELYISKDGELFTKMKKDRERMKEIKLTKRTTAELVGRLFMEEAMITITQLGILKNEIENPSFEYGVENTLWNFYNATTFALKDSHPELNMKQHIDLHNFVTNEFKLPY